MKNIELLRKQYFIHPDKTDEEAIKEVAEIDAYVKHKIITDIDYVPKNIEEARQHPLWVEGHLKLVNLAFVFVTVYYIFALFFWMGFLESLGNLNIPAYLSLFMIILIWVVNRRGKSKKKFIQTTLFLIVSYFLYMITICSVLYIIEPSALESLMDDFIFAPPMLALLIIISWLIPWLVSMAFYRKAYKANYSVTCSFRNSK